MTFSLNEMYGYSRLCDRLRSSAIIWKQVSLRSSAIYDPRSAIRDRLRSFAIIWKPLMTFYFFFNTSSVFVIVAGPNPAGVIALKSLYFVLLCFPLSRRFTTIYR